MTGSPPSQAALAAGVLERHWRITEPAIRTALGVSRGTWRIGTSYWLSQSEEARSAELVRQANLLIDLENHLKTEHFQISVPEMIATVSGSLVVKDGGYVWCLTRNLDGFHPDVADPDMYPVLTEGLARFHRTLRVFAEHRQQNVPDGICVRARQNIERLDPATFVAFTSYPRELEVLQQATAWLLQRLDRFELLPRQIVHGDWTPQNVLFDRAEPPTRLTAVLDFEAMACDPVHVDLANTCSTLLMWSGLVKVDDRITDVLDMYERSAGVHIEREHIHTAMLAHWLCHYWSWRDRLRLGEFGPEVKERLCLRISSVLSYVSKESVKPQ